MADSSHQFISLQTGSMDVFFVRMHDRNHFPDRNKITRRCLMKYTNRMLALTLTLTMLPLLATAQLTSSQKLVTQVPFEFVLGSKIVPAGEWIVQLASMGSKTLVIGNSKAEGALFSNT